ncbi:MAG TPA: hypothetical protein VMT90_00740 [Dehalococcoidia bacterium]|jgi:hypothetical protein|nr:hypothetical protein [Dehalococcoidia bacterium]
MTSFPSRQWFEDLASRAADDEELFKKLGYVEAKVGIKIDANGRGTRGYLLDFSGYRVSSVAEVADPVPQSDFTIEGTLTAWTDMVRNIQENGEPDLEHTLNRLTMAGVPLKLVASDQLQADIFFRMNQSFQAFFNEAVKVPTEFAS